MNYAKLALVSSLLVGSASFAVEPVQEKLIWNCSDTVACIAITGPYHKASAQIGFLTLTAEDTRAQSTCCQLSSEIHRQACAQGVNPQGAIVTCE